MDRKVFRFEGFRQGLDTLKDKSNISVKALTEAVNCVITSGGVVKTRLGTKKFTTSTTWDSVDLSASKVDGMFSFTTSGGTEYLIVAAGGYVFYTTGAAAMTKLEYAGSVDVTYTSGTEWYFAALNDCIYGINGLDPVTTAAGHTSDRMLKISGTTCTGITSSIPAACRYLTLHQDMLWAVPDADPSYLYHSEVATPETWTGSNDGNYWRVANDDGENVRGICPYREGLIIGKPHSLFYLNTVSRQTAGASPQDTTDDWSLVRVGGRNNNHGALFHRSMQPFNGGITYQSWSGVCWTDSRDIEVLSKNVVELSGLPQNDSSTHQKSQSQATDWFHASAEGGVGYGAAAHSDYPHQLRQLLFDANRKYTNDGGTLSGLQIKENWKNHGEQYLTLDTLVDTWDRPNESRYSPTWTEDVGVWDATGAEGSRVYRGNGYSPIANARTRTATTQGASAADGYWGVSVRRRYIRGGSERIGFAHTDANNDGYAVFFAQNRVYLAQVDNMNITTTSIITYAAFTMAWGTWYELQFRRKGSTQASFSVKVNGTEYITSLPNASFTGDFTRIHLLSWNSEAYFKDLWEDSTATASGTYTSSNIDMGAYFDGDATDGVATFGHIAYNAYLPSGSTITFHVASAANTGALDSATWRAVVAGDIDKALTDASDAVDRWFKWKVTLAAATTGFDIPRLYSVSLGNTWISPSHDLAAAPTNWGMFTTVDELGEVSGGSIDYYFRTKATNDFASGDTWDKIEHLDDLQSAANNGTAARYLQFKIVQDVQFIQSGTSIGTWVKDMSERINDGDENANGTMPYTDKISLFYYTGTEIATTCAMVDNDNHYLLFYSDLDSEKNNKGYCVHDWFWRDEETDLVAALTDWRDMHVTCTGEYKNRRLYGDSREGTIWIQGVGHLDDNRQINTKIQTANTDIGVPEFKKVFRVGYPTVFSNPFYYLGINADSNGWNFGEVLGSNKMNTFRRVFRGNNAGCRAQFEFRPTVTMMRTNPKWDSQTAGANIYWHEDEYLYAKIDNSTTNIRRYYKSLPEALDADGDDYGFWAMLEPVDLTTDSDALMLMGFFNPADTTDNKQSFCGFIYENKSGNDKMYAAIIDDAGAILSGNETTAAATMAATSEYFVDFSFKEGTLRAVLYDSNFAKLTEVSNTPTITGTYANLTHFGILNYPSATAGYQEWKVKAICTYDPKECPSGMKDATAKIEITGMDVEYLLGRRLIRGLR